MNKLKRVMNIAVFVEPAVFPFISNEFEFVIPHVLDREQVDV